MPASTPRTFRSIDPISRFLRNERGQSLTEFAVIFPLLAILFIGTIDFARVYYAGIAVDHAAHAGVEYGAQSVGKSGDTAGMQRTAQNAASNDVGSVTATATHWCECSDGTDVDCVSGTCSTGSPRVYVQVTVAKTFQTLFNYPHIPTSVNLTRTATMRVQ